jgi:hypothetical protein
MRVLVISFCTPTQIFPRPTSFKPQTAPISLTLHITPNVTPPARHPVAEQKLHEFLHVYDNFSFYDLINILARE